MKFVAISDTHGQHRNLILPQGDVLIHAGDLTRRGEENEVMDFLEWFSHTLFSYKVFIAGNHDFYFEKTPDEMIAGILPKEVIYLKDSYTIIEGIKIWGSPVQPYFYDWAFNRHRGEDIRKHWNLIPEDTNILVTHGPVYGLLDTNFYLQNVGCEDLLEKVLNIKPEVFISGHIHEAYGVVDKEGTKFINASVLDEKYKLKNPPVVFTKKVGKALTQ